MVDDALKLLPIGSVVLLKEGKKEIMITGFFVVSEEEKDKVYDYSACLYPEGIITSNQNLLFNHDQISKILHVGYVIEEERNFKTTLNEGIKKIEEITKASLSYNKEE